MATLSRHAGSAPSGRRSITGTRPWGVRSPRRLGGPVRWGAGLMARLAAPWLDGQLARGVTPWQSRVHAARCLQITSLRSRERLAVCLEGLLARGHQAPHAGLSSAVPIRRDTVLAAEPEIRALCARLRDGAPIAGPGVAALGALLSDGSGPIYAPSVDGQLRRTLAAVLGALDVPE